MKLEITIGSQQLMFLAVFIVVLAVVGIAGAYNPSGTGGTPSVMGHSVDELDWSKPISNLYVNGSVKITGGSPGAGKVLTSDASGLASWQASAGGGDITDVNGGSGLIPDTCSSGSCTLNVNTGATLTTGLEIVSDQVRLMDNGCVAGEVLKRNAANNGWGCVPDDNAGLTCNTKTGTFSAYGELYCDAGYTAVFGSCGGAAAIWSNGCPSAGNCGLLPNADAATGMCWRMPPGSTITLYLRCCR